MFGDATDGVARKQIRVKIAICIDLGRSRRIFFVILNFSFVSLHQKYCPVDLHWISIEFVFNTTSRLQQIFLCSQFIYILLFNSMKVL